MTSASFATFTDIGADSASYTVQGSDVGDYIRVVATTNDISNPATAMSAVTGAVLPTAPVLSIADHALSVNEEGSVALGISEMPANQSDPVTITINGIPQDATLTDRNGDALTITNDSITLNPSELAGLTLHAGDTSETLSVFATNTLGPTISSPLQTITVNPVAPTITGTVAGQTTTSEAPVTPFSGVTIGDANNNGTDTDTLTITYAAGDGTLTDGAGFPGTSSLSGASGDYTLTGTAAAITAELDALSFTPVDGVPNTAVTTTFTLSDLSSVYGTATVDSTTTVTDSDPPSGWFTDTWTAGVSGDWTDGGDWSAGSPPSAGDQAAIGTGGNPQFNSSGSLDDIALQNAGTLGVAFGAMLLLDEGTTIVGDGTGTLTIGNYGTLDIELGLSNITNLGATLDGVTVYDYSYFGNIEVGEFELGDAAA